MNLLVGSEYLLTLGSGRTVAVIVHGQVAVSNLWEISADGVRGTYSSIDEAVGEPVDLTAATVKVQGQRQSGAKTLG